MDLCFVRVCSSEQQSSPRTICHLQGCACCHLSCGCGGQCLEDLDVGLAQGKRRKSRACTRLRRHLWPFRPFLLSIRCRLRLLARSAKTKRSSGYSPSLKRSKKRSQLYQLQSNRTPPTLESMNDVSFAEKYDSNSHRARHLQCSLR